MTQQRQQRRGEGINWTRDARPAARPRIDLLRPRVGLPVSAVALADSVDGCDLHYIDRRTFPCTRLSGVCECCQDGIGWRRGFFLAVAGFPGWKPAILAITEGAYRGCPALHGEGANLRGYIVRAERIGRVDTGPMRVEVQRHCGADPLPKLFDLREALMRIWGLNPATGAVE